MKHLWLLLVVVSVIAGTPACRGSVTETGNVCPGGDCTGQPEAESPGDVDGGNEPTAPAPPNTTDQGHVRDDAIADPVTYVNKPYGVTIGAPSSWSIAERAAGDPVHKIPAIVEFTRAAAACPVEQLVSVSIAKLTGNTITLRDIAEAAGGGCLPKAYSAGEASGFFCDLLTAGDRTSGLSLKGQFFLSADGPVYVIASVVACESGAAGVDLIIKHIAFP